MFKRLTLATLIVTGLIAISAAQRTDDPSLRPASDTKSGAFSIALTDDPFPCPECNPGDGNGPDPLRIAASPIAITDDPFPCPECNPGDGNGPDPVRIAATPIALTDDPFPCPECNPGDGNGPDPDKIAVSP